MLFFTSACTTKLFWIFGLEKSGLGINYPSYQFSSKTVTIASTSFTICFVAFNVLDSEFGLGLLINRFLLIQNGEIIGDPDHRGFDEKIMEKYYNVWQGNSNEMIVNRCFYNDRRGESLVKETHIIIIL